MKKLDKLILQAFAGPFLLTFAVVEFIFLTQVLLKYLDDIVGKDLGMVVILKLLFFLSVTIVPISLPLAVLLSSLMTYGNLGEHHELTAIKASGIALTRILRPVWIVSLLLAGIAFWFNDSVVPKANLKFGSLLYDVRNKKLSFLIKPGVFNNAIPGYAIRVDSKEEDGTLHNIMIYDHRENSGIPKVILAKEGKMNKTTDGKFLVLNLKNGVQYEEQASKNGMYNPR
ncbi:MAG: YjgP/YjgQ family permease, partial [Hymenobacter sp.]